jgi:hypothetical protein
MRLKPKSEQADEPTPGSLLPGSPVYRLLERLAEAVAHRLWPPQSGDKPVVVKTDAKESKAKRD